MPGQHAGRFSNSQFANLKKSVGRRLNQHNLTPKLAVERLPLVIPLEFEIKMSCTAAVTVYRPSASVCSTFVASLRSIEEYFYHCLQTLVHVHMINKLGREETLCGLPSDKSVSSSSLPSRSLSSLASTYHLSVSQYRLWFVAASTISFFALNRHCTNEQKKSSMIINNYPPRARWI